jgi:hypothetical protein
MAKKRFEIVRPKSLTDSVYEDYEYLIRWIGRDGADYIFMFYDAEIEHKINSEIINQQDSDKIEALIENEGREITLTADDLTKNDLTVIGQIFSNKFVTRLKKDLTTERYAPDGGSYKYRLMKGRYQVEFKLIMSDLATWK